MASEALFLVLPREGAAYDIPPFHTFLYPYVVLCGVDLLIHLRMYADFPGTLGAQGSMINWHMTKAESRELQQSAK